MNSTKVLTAPLTAPCVTRDSTSNPRNVEFLKKIQHKSLEGNTNTSRDSTDKPYNINNFKCSKYGRRDWCFTYFNSKDSPPPFVEKDMKYLIYGSEICPKTKNHHWQSYVYFYNSKTFSATKKYFSKLLNCNVHFEPCRGSIDENIAYCSKDNKYFEHGIKPQQGVRNDLDDVKNNILNGNISIDELIIENPTLYHQYGRTLDKIEDIYFKSIKRNHITTCDWIYGDTKTGKSEYAFSNYDIKTHYNLNIEDNGWWDGYHGQHTVIINEFRGQIKYSQLLELIDKYPMTVKRRNRNPVPFTSKHIIITSSLSPKEVYNNLSINDNLNQLYRRINIIERYRKINYSDEELILLKKLFNKFKKDWIINKYSDNKCIKSNNPLDD